jgi:hypothetical protein
VRKHEEFSGNLARQEYLYNCVVDCPMAVVDGNSYVFVATEVSGKGLFKRHQLPTQAPHTVELGTELLEAVVHR